MSIIKTFLNNGFFVLLLAAVVILYIAYSTSSKDEVSLAKEELVVMAPVAEDEEPSVSVIEVIENSVVELVEVLVPAQNKESEEVASSVLNNAKEEESKVDVNEVLSQFGSFQEAINAARKAFHEQDFLGAEKIYYALAAKTPTPSVLGEFGNTLFQSGKKELADIAWIDAGKMLIQSNRTNEAMRLGNQLSIISGKASKEILDAVFKVMNKPVPRQQVFSVLNKQEILDYQQQIQQKMERENAYWKKRVEASFLKKEQYMNEQKIRMDEYAKQMQIYYENLKIFMQQQAQERYTPTAGSTQ